MSDRRAQGRRMLALVALALVAALGGLYWLLFVRVPATPTATPPPPPKAGDTLILATISGGVEVAGADGVFHPAIAGRPLSPRDRVRTSDDGEARLQGSDGSEVRLGGATSVHIDEVGRELRRLSLGQGLVQADIPSDPTRVFELGFAQAGAGADASARTRSGRFTAIANGNGTTAVASHRGEVVLSARGREVVIHAGEQSRILPGQAPEQPTPIPASLFLKVNWPATLTTSRRVTVRGTTQPGARVRVGDHWLSVDEKGAFTSTLDLADGPHQLSARAVDVGGHAEEAQSPRIVVDTEAHLKVQSPHWPSPR